MVCAAFNADFDGDQMAVHVPLSVEAQVEARVLMMSINNILSRQRQADRRAVAGHGAWLLLADEGTRGAKGEGKVFGPPRKWRIAFDAREVEEHARIKVRIDGNLVQTTVGRVMLSEVLPAGMPFSYANKLMTKKEVTKAYRSVYRQSGHRETVMFLDKIKDAGFTYATRAGVSICIDNMHIPSKKEELIGKAQREVNEIERSMPKD